jgi:pyruvate dehydrogenase E1 component alpha subunit
VNAIPTETAFRLYCSMVRIRVIEERLAARYAEQEMRCPTHFSIGQEAVAAGVCEHLAADDYVLSAHRSHAHYLAKGGALQAMVSELYGKADGCARGKGGSMHLIDLSVGFLGCVPIVGSTISIGVGAAFAAKMKGEHRSTVIFFGDGATETGVFHESLNFAQIHKLSVLFVCENNLYSVLTPLAARQPEGREIVDLARSHKMPVEQVDGQDVLAVHTAAGRLLDRARNGHGPGFLEAKTYRWLEHCGPLTDTHLAFRPDGEYESWRARCPIDALAVRLAREGSLAPVEMASIRATVEAEIEGAIIRAKQGLFPDHSELLTDVYPA